ncbi:MAG: UDP-N-acetylmuramate dehydrogenase [Anaerolineae bacterium]|nr:UDP-N-acetylmuramate dehydrogenase [Thermoflexales bacterium]MDW8406690.1 UDP-N-acetylmuramate dehydrogenase [Anaerolineae bacterium]
MDILDLLKSRAKRNEPLARYTTARIGGPADLLVEARTVEELVALVNRADEVGMPCIVVGGGANMLVSDAGVRGLVVLNRTRATRFEMKELSARVEADSGVVLATLARECIERGLAGIEWAIGVPGTVGGAVVGNAGAYGTEVATNLHLARVLRRGRQPEYWTPRQLAFAYRQSALKRYRPESRPIVLSALFDLKRDHRVNLERRAAEFQARRRASQPPGATMGSMFKNPPGDYAGRLIDACGLKGARRGGAMISPVHANFFVNTTGQATATDVKALIDLARETVRQQFGIWLELEIELVGDWPDLPPEEPDDTAQRATPALDPPTDSSTRLD